MNLKMYYTSSMNKYNKIWIHIWNGRPQICSRRMRYTKLINHKVGGRFFTFIRQLKVWILESGQPFQNPNTRVRSRGLTLIRLLIKTSSCVPHLWKFASSNLQFVVGSMASLLTYADWPVSEPPLESTLWTEIWSWKLSEEVSSQEKLEWTNPLSEKSYLRKHRHLTLRTHLQSLLDLEDSIN